MNAVTSGMTNPPPRRYPSSRDATVIVPGTALVAHAARAFPPSIATPSSSSLTSGASSATMRPS